jgi:hypothetical protein
MVSGNSQGYANPTFGVDAALRYEFLKNKVASLTLTVATFSAQENPMCIPRRTISRSIQYVPVTSNFSV